MWFNLLINILGSFARIMSTSVRGVMSKGRVIE